jgi:hypothetical protein
MKTVLTLPVFKVEELRAMLAQEKLHSIPTTNQCRPAPIPSRDRDEGAVMVRIFSQVLSELPSDRDA